MVLLSFSPWPVGGHTCLSLRGLRRGGYDPALIEHRRLRGALIADAVFVFIFDAPNDAIEGVAGLGVQWRDDDHIRPRGFARMFGALGFRRF